MKASGLPVDDVIPDIVSALDSAGAVVVQAEPGAGKTTGVPRSLLAHLKPSAPIWVTQPRRMAARLVAHRVAELEGEPIGQSVGYQVRLERKGGADTRLWFVTEGILVRKLFNGALNASVVVLDEVHERNLETDFLLARLRHLRREDPSLRIVAMSATLDADAVGAFLDAPVVQAAGRQHLIETTYQPIAQGERLERSVLTAVTQALTSDRGNILVFLPGRGEIDACATACRRLQSSNLALCKLYGALSLRDQQAALRDDGVRKVIFSTNVAETSVTPPGVTTVIDSGWVREARHDATDGTSLERVRVSQASAQQRAGRAGRLGPGRCIRLYSRVDYQSRDQFQAPQIVRDDLLTLALWSADTPELSWLNPPNPKAWEAAQTGLEVLGARSGDDVLTESGRTLRSMPLGPRLAAVVHAARRRNCGWLGCLAACMIDGAFVGQRDDGPADLIARVIDMAASRLPDALRTEWSRLLQVLGEPKPSEVFVSRELETTLGEAILQGHADRVARKIDKARYQTFGGQQVEVSNDAPEWICILGLRRTNRKGARSRVTLFSEVQPDALLAWDGLIEDEEQILWDAKKERVVRKQVLRYGALALDESNLPPDKQVSMRLFEEAIKRKPSTLVDPKRWRRLSQRMEALGESERLAEIWEISLLEQCDGRASLQDVIDADLLAWVEQALGPEAMKQLHLDAPARVKLANGTSLSVTYDPGKPPWVESYLQDFFGLSRLPEIGGQGLVAHLWGPNKRAIQVTADLEGFWAKHYPELRPALSRRYPKHHWPDDPLASPPVRLKSRLKS